MREKGFTLAELMGVIVILSIIAVIVLVTADRSIKNSQTTTCQAQEKNIIEGAKTFVTDHTDRLPTVAGDSGAKEITMTELQAGGYVEEGLVNPMTDLPYPSSLKIKVKTTTGMDYQFYIINIQDKEKCPGGEFYEEDNS